MKQSVGFCGAFCAVEGFILDGISENFGPKIKMKNWKPIFVENSKIPVWLSKIAPIQIHAITMGVIVFCKGEMDERTKRHETIHFQQFVETIFVGFLLLYIWDYIFGLAKYKKGSIAYKKIRAEVEAYKNDEDVNYLKNRKRFQWIFIKNKGENDEEMPKMS